LGEHPSQNESNRGGKAEDRAVEAEACPRSLPEKIARKVASTCGIIAAAAAPWTMRAAINSPGVCARPATRLATPKSVTPSRKMRLRPYKSPKLPAVISVAANASM
jgi:hypothetical protein